MESLAGAHCLLRQTTMELGARRPATGYSRSLKPKSPDQNIFQAAVAAADRQQN